jgi:two-component system osmolarity sensor histidine kinase EnvZ
MVAREEDIARSKPDMAAHVPRQMQHLDLGGANCHHLTVCQPAVRLKAQIRPFTTRQTLACKPGHDAAAATVSRAEAENFGARSGHQPGHQGRMVQMCMRHQNRRDPFARTQCPKQVFQMIVQVGAWVDHGHLAFAQQIAVGPGSGQWRRIVGADLSDQRHRGFPWAGLARKIMCMAFHFKSYMPRSLFGRAALILIVPIVTIQLVLSIVFIQRHFDGVTRQLSRGVLLEVRSLQRTVDSAPDLAAAHSAGTLVARDLSIQMKLPPRQIAPVGDLRSVWDLSGRAVGTTLHDGLPRLTSVDLQTNPREVHLWLETTHGPMHLVLPRSRVTASNPHQLLVLTALASILMTVVAYVFLRNQLSPITRLAAAAEAFGRGQTLTYRPRGALEVRAAGNAFLDMRSRIERQIEQRTLMLSGVSHDLRGPLTRLKLGLSLLPQDGDTAALLQDVEDMSRLVEEFLAFARGDAMEESAEVDPAAIVAQVIEKSRRLAVNLALGECHGVGRLQMRPQAIVRALDNLIGNALRYGTHARLSYTLTDRTLRLTVEDDGPGIPADKREEAILPFTRLDAARDPNKGGGVGLGLSIAADIARTHGGILRLGDSEDLGGLKADLVLKR